MSPIYLLALTWVVVLETPPFVDGSVSIAQTPVAQSAPTAATVPLAFSGQAVDGDFPATYRLPPIASAPVPSDLPNTEVFPLFSPPSAAGFTPTADATMYGAAVENPPVIVPANESLQALPIDMRVTPASSPPGERVAGRADDGQLAPAFAVARRPLAGSDPMGPIEVEPVLRVQGDPQLTSQLLPAVQRGYMLAQRGALFAARTEFVQVLRRVAQAKDVATDSDEHARALAAGLRALDEADDFVPEGVQLEANLDVRATASSHRTSALSEQDEKVLPHEAVTRYHEVAREQLARSVAGEQAGSMALYGLGRIDAQLAAQRDDDLKFVRGAMTMYASALEACPHNHLASNELGVLECRTGRPAEAARLFQQAIDFAPSATAYHNLAVAQQKLGLHANAEANERESLRLAAQERAGGTLSRRAGVHWVAPEELARVASPAGLTPPSTQAVNAPPPTKSPWQRTIELARALPRAGRETAADTPADPADTRVVWPTTPTHPTRWR